MSTAESDLAGGLAAADLVPGDVAGIQVSGDELRQLAGVLERGGSALARVEVTRWRGEAALAWESVVAREPGRWRTASDAFTSAAAALDGYASCFGPARELAEVARELYLRSSAPLLAGRVDLVPVAIADGTVESDLIAAMTSGRKQAVLMLERARSLVREAAATAAGSLRAAMAEAPQARRFYEATVRPPGAEDAMHVGLDGLGMLPVVGAVPDLANALWYASEERYLEAGLSAASAVPGPGDVVGGAVLAGSVAVKTVDDLDRVAVLSRAAREVDLGRGVEPGLFPSSSPGALLTHVPYGFGSRAEWGAFSRQVSESLKAAGVTDAVVYLRGSSVSGIRYTTGESIAVTGPGDYDLAIASTDLIQRAKAARISMRSASRTVPIEGPGLGRLGLQEMVTLLSPPGKPSVSLMIYKDGAGILRRGDAILMP